MNDQDIKSEHSTTDDKYEVMSRPDDSDETLEKLKAIVETFDNELKRYFDMGRTVPPHLKEHLAHFLPALLPNYLHILGTIMHTDDSINEDMTEVLDSVDWDLSHWLQKMQESMWIYFKDLGCRDSGRPSDAGDVDSGNIGNSLGNLLLLLRCCSGKQTGKGCSMKSLRSCWKSFEGEMSNPRLGGAGSGKQPG